MNGQVQSKDMYRLRKIIRPQAISLCRIGFEFGRHQLPPCRAALQNFVGSLPSLNRCREVFLHTPRTGSNPLSEQTSSMNVPSPLGMGVRDAGVTRADIGDGLGAVGDG